MKLRTVKKYGNTFAVKLEIADLKDYGIKAGDQLDLEEAIKKGNLDVKQWVK